MNAPARPSRRVVPALCLLLALAFTLVPAAHAVAADGVGPLIDLNAAALAPGEVRSWPNGGTLGGAFATDAATAPVAGDVAGRRAVTFGAGRTLGSSFHTPAELAGNRPFTLAVWAYL